MKNKRNQKLQSKNKSSAASLFSSSASAPLSGFVQNYEKTKKSVKSDIHDGHSHKAKRMMAISAFTTAHGYINNPYHMISSIIHKKMKSPIPDDVKVYDGNRKHIKTINGLTRKIIWDRS